MAKPEGFRSGKRAVLFVAFIAIATAGGMILASSQNSSGSLRDGGDARLISIQPLPLEGPFCPEETPALPIAAREAPAPMLAAMTKPAQGASRTAAPISVSASSDPGGQIAKRPAARVMRDPSAAFSGIAIDLKHNEVVMTDENNFAIMTYDRMENTPRTAKLSEPKRVIQGMEAYLEYNCSVYVDPETGDIYSVNNDTLNWLTVFNRDVKGNQPPSRKLRAPHTVYGIAVDEEKKEMFLADQDDHAVVIYKKEAKDEDSPVRVIQGSKTKLADPHGVAIDPKAHLLFVSNWGTYEDRPNLGDPSVKNPAMGRVVRTLWPVTRNYSFPSSGKIEAPSITVYRLDANGNAAPIRTIQGPKTLMDWPTALAIDTDHNELFVANDTADLVTVYSTDASGDVAPIRVLKGPKTMIKNPTGMAYDPKNEELWVANFGNHAATVFKRTAAGDVPPLRIIRSAPGDSPAPMMGNPHTIAYDTKREEILVSN
jgi:DNA-binding beta-propeller fold protein YncE